MDTSRYFWNENKNPSARATNSASGDGQTERPRFEPVRLGFVGIGLMGGATLERMLELPTVVTALCDVDEERLERAAQTVSTEPTRYRDYRELCADPDVEAVVVSTPDHWHTEIAVEAMEHGKDVYVEKPLSLTIDGGRRLADAAARLGRVVQTGSQQRSSHEFQQAVALVRSGVLGALTSIEVTLPPNNIEPPERVEREDVPRHFDHNLWLGPAPWREYNSQLTHYNFRFMRDYSGGQMTNWGAHHLDIVQWALDKDASGPTAVEGHGEFHAHGPFDTATTVDITYIYDGTLPVRCRTGIGPTGVEFRGSAGTLRVGRGRLEGEPAALVEQSIDPVSYGVRRSTNHYLDFLESVRTRNQPVAPAETGHRSATVCHLGNIAVRLGRRLEWDPVTESFGDDDEANRLRSRPQREWRA